MAANSVICAPRIVVTIANFKFAALAKPDAEFEVCNGISCVPNTLRECSPFQ
jgi:hypothetical protein